MRVEPGWIRASVVDGPDLSHTRLNFEDISSPRWTMTWLKPAMLLLPLISALAAGSDGPRACASFAIALPMPSPAWPRPPVRGALAQILNQVIEGLDGGDPDVTGLGPSSMPR
jgi:hypothetical protein